MLRRVRIQLSGAVQGVGMRPALVRHARRWRVSGWVKNLSGAVELEVQGNSEQLDGFLASFREALPRAARLDQLEQARIPVAEPSQAFEIIESTARGSSAPTLSPDRVTCKACLSEMGSPGDRRHRYALNSCAECGPRYAITQAAPYDRQRTSLGAFPLCDTCQAEYADLENRRFHTEGIVCPTCGPQVHWLTGAGQRTGAEPLGAAISALRGGQLIALKGVSGFQLLVDACNEAAVARLRACKRRPVKPFAVLFRDVAQLEGYASLSHAEICELQSPAGPIVLCRGRAPRAGAPRLAPSVSPLVSLTPELSDTAPSGAAWLREAWPWVGAMLPTSGLHWMLAEGYGGPLVCTSANASEEPLCGHLDELLVALPGVCDGVLDHDRSIVRRLDDSVVRLSASGRHVVRRGRGLVPHPLPLKWPTTPPGRRAPTVLSLGGQLKAAVCWLEGAQAELSQHLGDLHGTNATRTYEAAIDDLLSRRGRPDAIACDAHPDYVSSRIAEALAERLGAPLLRFGHHRAHVAAVLAERGLSGTCVALAWDGLGLGEDGALWGGEAFLLGSGSSAASVPRIASLRPFALPGGERALREPRRVALSLLLHAGLGTQLVDAAFSEGERRTLEQLQRASAANCSSIGRLFDAVASLLGLCHRNAYEAHAASLLELCAQHASLAEPLSLTWRNASEIDASWELDWAPLLEDLVRSMQRGVEQPALALGFHRALADAALELASLCHADSMLLAGGCFQNSLLSRLICEGAARRGLPCTLAGEAPAGDGGLALGQAALGRSALLDRQCHEEARSCA